MSGSFPDDTPSDCPSHRRPGRLHRRPRAGQVHITVPTHPAVHRNHRPDLARNGPPRPPRHRPSHHHRCPPPSGRNRNQSRSVRHRPSRLRRTASPQTVHPDAAHGPSPAPTSPATSCNAPPRRPRPPQRAPAPAPTYQNPPPTNRSSRRRAPWPLSPPTCRLRQRYPPTKSPPRLRDLPIAVS